MIRWTYPLSGNVGSLILAKTDVICKCRRGFGSYAVFGRVDDFLGLEKLFGDFS